VQSLRPWLEYTCGSRRSFASNALSDFGSGTGHRSLGMHVSNFGLLWKLTEGEF
jgi:hypothetical protein